LDTEQDKDWEEVIGLLSETNGIDVTLNDDGSVTLRWEPSVEKARSVEIV
jgi:hypothetical protein